MACAFAAATRETAGDPAPGARDVLREMTVARSPDPLRPVRVVLLERGGDVLPEPLAAKHHEDERHTCFVLEASMLKG